MLLNELNDIISTKPKLKSKIDENIYFGLKVFSKNENTFVIVEDIEGDVYSIDINNIILFNDKEIEIDNNFDFDLR